MSYLIAKTMLSHIGCLGLLAFNLMGAELNPFGFKIFRGATMAATRLITHLLRPSIHPPKCIIWQPI
jgi:hypothetical protein